MSSNSDMVNSVIGKDYFNMYVFQGAVFWIYRTVNSCTATIWTVTLKVSPNEN